MTFFAPNKSSKSIWLLTKLRELSTHTSHHACLLLGLPQQTIWKLQTVQNAAAHLIIHVKRQQHITPVFIQLHWLPVANCIPFKMLLLLFKFLQGQGTEYLQELLIPYVPIRNLRSSNDRKLLYQIATIRTMGREHSASEVQLSGTSCLWP